MSDSSYWNVYAGLDSDDVNYDLMLQYDDDQVDYEDYEDAVAVQAQERLDGSRNNVHDLQSGSGQINTNNSNSQIKTDEESILDGRMSILLVCFFVWILLRLIKRWRSRTSQSVDLPKYHVYPKD